MLQRFQAPSLLTSSQSSNICRSGFLALVSWKPRAFGLKTQLQWWTFLIILPSEKWYRNDRAILVKILNDFQAAGNAFPSFVSNTLENGSSLSPEDIKDVKFTASSMYGGMLYQIKSTLSLTRKSLASRWGWHHSLRRIRLLSGYGSLSRFILYSSYKTTIWSFFLQMFKKRHARNWMLSSVKGVYLDFLTDPTYHTSMPSLQKFSDGIVLLPQVIPSSPGLRDDFVTQSCRRSAYGFGRWFHWRLLYS